jgi:hypothetical protein
MVYYDGTIRNSLGDLIQFVYGEDGMDSAFIERRNIVTFSLNNRVRTQLSSRCYRSSWRLFTRRAAGGLR